MKVWASASAIGLSMAYFATACSSEPPPDDMYQPTGGTPGGGGSAGAASTMGGDTSTMGGSAAGTTPAGGTPGAGAGPMGGSTTAGTGGDGTGGTPPGGECPEGVLGHCKAGEQYPTYEGYTLALVEEFDAPLDLNNDPIWTWSDGSPADGQTGFREEQIKFEGGYMTLTAEMPPGCTPTNGNPECIAPRMSYGEAKGPNAQDQVGAMGVWSGELRSKYNNYRYGRYEAKFAPPVANAAGKDGVGTAGNYLSTLFVFRTPKNIVWNEIDIELEPHQGPTKIFGNIINATGAFGYPAGNAAPWDVTGPGAFNMYDEHVYAFNWTPTKVEWFVDGQLIREFTGTGAVPIPDKSTKIMMNLWIFASSAAFGNPAQNQYPFTAKYDWFRFYKLNTETTYPCSPTPACLPADDKTQSSQNNPKEMNYGQ